MVTRRMWPLQVEGRVVHQIGLPFHWAFAGEVVGDNANDLTSLVADPNVSMHEAKAFACQVYPGRREGAVPKPTKARRPGRPESRYRTRRPRRSRRGDSDVTSREKELAGALPRAATRLIACRCSWSGSIEPFRRWLPPSPVRPPASTPTRPSASAARRARSRASNGTSFPRTGSTWTGNSYDNTGELSATSWRHVKFIEQLPDKGVPVLPGPDSDAFDPGRWLMMSDVCKHCVTAPCQQACPTGRPHPQRVRQRLHPAGHLQRLRLLHRRLPLRGHHPQHDRRPRSQVHAVLRPPARRPGARLRQGLPDRVDPVRPDRRAAGAGPEAGGGPAPARGLRCVPVWRCAGTELLRAEFVLPPASIARRCTACPRRRSTRGSP